MMDDSEIEVIEVPKETTNDADVVDLISDYEEDYEPTSASTDSDPDWKFAKVVKKKIKKNVPSSISENPSLPKEKAKKVSASECCRCKGDCSSKLCGCRKADRICGKECKCNDTKCQNRQIKVLASVDNQAQSVSEEFVTPTTKVTVVVTTEVIQEKKAALKKPRVRKTAVKKEVPKARKVPKKNLKLNEKQPDLESAPLIQGSEKQEGSSLSDEEIQKLLKDYHTFCEWRDEEVISEITEVLLYVVKNVMNLLDQDCTIPFIARYRKELTDDLQAEKLREIQDVYESIKAVHKKGESVVKILARENKLTAELVKAISNAKTLAEIEHLYAPFKPGSKRTLAERARKLGLEEPALRLWTGNASISSLQLFNILKPDVKGLTSVDEVLAGIRHIIADIISKDRDVLDYIRTMSTHPHINISCKMSTSVAKEEKQAVAAGKESTNFKYENYYNFTGSIKNIKSYQVLAINRGETQKCLTVKVDVPPFIKHETIQMCQRKWYNCVSRFTDDQTSEFIKSCSEDSYDRLLEPHFTRQIRADLTKKAEKESVNVFCTNLKCLLLAPPVRGRTVLGVDPGFSHGCKLAVVSPTGEVLGTEVIYPHAHNNKKNVHDSEKLSNLVVQFRCATVALGNGTACRETEAYISNLIKSGFFSPLDLKYCIVNECGASIYSITKEADLDLPNMDPNLRSAVSIARRLQDPLLEYVKIEPKHLGVGMYQHDVTEAVLKNALDSVVVECVSFVGVDLNVCSEVVLRRISGLSEVKAKKIIEWRDKNGPFQNRRQLLLVPGLGPKSFEQCAGFIKILPQTSCAEKTITSTETESQGAMPGQVKRKMTGNQNKSKKSKKEISSVPNPLDMTVIHPESYLIAERFISDSGASALEIGQESLCNKIRSYSNSIDIEEMAKKYDTSTATIKLIVDSLSQPVEYDIREEFDKPLFRTGVTSIDNLKVDEIMTGRVTNVTEFGAFVDIGVGQDGLIYVSKMQDQRINLGNRVKVKVINVDVKKKRIGLELCSDSPDLIRNTNKGSSQNKPRHQSNQQRSIQPFRNKNRNLGFQEAPNNKEDMLASLSVGKVLSGKVVNVTRFGTFVDIGIGTNGLIHISKLQKRLSLGDEVRVKVVHLNIPSKRISLELHSGSPTPPTQTNQLSHHDGNINLRIANAQNQPFKNIKQNEPTAPMRPVQFSGFGINPNSQSSFDALFSNSKQESLLGPPPCILRLDTNINMKIENNSSQEVKQDSPNLSLQKPSSIRDLCVGQKFSGKVRNLANYGTFVSLSDNITGLIHISRLQGQQLRKGDCVEVKIIGIDLVRNRISLQFERLL